MKLLRADNLQRLSRETVFREPPLATCAAFLAVCLLAAGTQGVLWKMDLWWFAVLFIPLWLLVLPALFSAARNSFSAENWLLRAGPEGLMLHIRSYRNRHFPRDCETVVYLSWNEVAKVSGLLEWQSVPHTPDLLYRHMIRRRRFLELDLKTDTEGLRRAVAAERERKAPKVGISRSKSHHYPVTVAAPGLVRVEFGGVRPALERALELLGEWAPCQREPRRLDTDWERMEAEELDRFTARLYREGDMISAVQIVRRRYRVSLNEAKDYVLRLANLPP